MRVLMVDNYDSFTYNLVHLLEELGADVVVRRSDEIDAEGGERSRRTGSSSHRGPGRPRGRAARSS